MAEPLVLFFKDIAMSDQPAVGGKGANLAEMTRAGIAVPPGFVVTTGCYNSFLNAIDPGRKLRGSIETLDAQDLPAIDKAGAEARAQIIAAALPDAIDEAIAMAHGALCAAEEFPVAVRSSATGEDSEDTSFAGLQDTYLWLKGPAQVAEHVRACWASLYSSESIAYRRRLGLSEDGLAMGVVVQRMVDARCAGVMFTRSPASGDRSVIVIEGSYGLGSAIVSGEVTPDRYVINKVSGEITEATVSRKLIQHVPDLEAGGVREEAVPEAQQDAACLSEAEIAMLVETGKRIERHYGRPQDIEWAISRVPGEGLFLLQSRPETVWSRKDATPVIQPKANALDHVFAVFGGNRRP